MSEPTLQEVMKSQGTRLQDLPPWMTYAAQMDTKLSPEMEEAVKRYSEQRHTKSSSQTEEELCRQQEINAEIAKQYQWLHPSEYADEGPRIGKILHSSELINILRRDCKLKCWYRDHPQPKKITLVVQREGQAPEVGAWVQFGFMPEYTIMGFDDKGVPLAERFRGWRTVVLQLILKGLLTERQVNKHFGYAHGPVCDRYLRTLQAFRNAGNII